MIESVEYRREMNRNYLVIHSDLQWNDVYTVRMLSGNNISGLLQFHEKWLNGQVMFYYDITSKQPLNRLAEQRAITFPELRRIITDLVAVLKEMERYLLDERRICLSPEYIYVEPETYQCSVCMIPGYCADFPREFLNLSQYLLDYIDHGDGDAVVLAFSVFRECRKLNFGVEDIERCLGSEDGRNRGEETAIMPNMREMDVSEVPLALPGPDLSGEADCSKDIRMKRSYGWAAAAILIFSAVISIVSGTWMFAVMGMIMSSLAIVVYRFIFEGDCGESTKKQTDQAISLESLFAMEESEWRGEQKGTLRTPMDKNAGVTPEDSSEDDDMQTVLLTSKASECQEKRTLLALEDGLKISIDYFPFLVGKSRGLADYCLDKPGISRLHIRLEQQEDSFFIMDLNSTNGTKLNGESLNTNETRVLRVGDEIDMAGNVFRFQ